MTDREKLITELKEMAAYMHKIVSWLFLCAKGVKPVIHFLGSLKASFCKSENNYNTNLLGEFKQKNVHDNCKLFKNIFTKKPYLL